MGKLLAVLLFVPAMARADFFDGNRLLNELRDVNGYGFFTSIGYIQGVVDAHSSLFFCPPTNVTAGQVRDMVKNHLDANPQIRHIAAERIIREQFEKVWPCRNRGSGGGGTRL